MIHDHSVEIIVRGVPGSGKTVVMSLLAHLLRLEAPAAEVLVDVSEEVLDPTTCRSCLSAMDGRLHVRLRTEQVPKSTTRSKRRTR